MDKSSMASVALKRRRVTLTYLFMDCCHIVAEATADFMYANFFPGRTTIAFGYDFWKGKATLKHVGG
jgi:hypothetical protein